ncbi:histidine phosphatase family protein [Exercitatus varius]|uniref:histidine phosphatase family protein n=1 Tax=Exercitatus varius TaxID=67857 RepID=UPI00294B36D3|nr:histidine phosphatase family protein [Exercitatus varius]MDG2951369.1 histidine phosphatase family protein [Exercitatus varius]
MKKDIRFYLIRHGRTVWNEQGLMQGWGNSDLTEEGVKGAKLTGLALNKVPFVAAYSSCLQRTIDTANHILDGRNVPLFQHNGLNEHYFGSWEGTNVELIRQTQEFQQMVSDPVNYKALTNGGETWEQLADRTTKAIDDIIRIHDNGNILIVSHGHTVRLLMAIFGGATWQTHRDPGRSEAMKNTSINIVRYVRNGQADSGRFIVEKVNDTRHLQ